MSNCFCQSEVEKNLQHLNLASKNLAIEGYDPVAFFYVNKAVAGNSKYTLKHKGVLYHFSSEKNKKLFPNL